MSEQSKFVFPNPSSISGSKRTRVGGRLLLLVILIVFAGATYFALNQDPKPNPYTKPSPWETIYYPQEKNAFMRLPIINGDLNDIFVLPGSKKLWAVGEQGLIIHSPDGGNTWQQQGFPGAEQAAELSLLRVIQPETDTQLFPASIDFSPFAKAYAAEAPASPSSQQTLQAASQPAQQNRQPSIEELKKADAERNRNVQERQPQQIIQQPPQQQQQQQQQVETLSIDEIQQQLEQAIIEEEPAVIDEADENPPVEKVLPDLNAVWFVNETTGFIVGDKGTLLATRDGGQSWLQQIIPSSNHLQALTFTPSGEEGWVVGHAGTILSTKNGGESWQRQDSQTRADLLAVATTGSWAWAVGKSGSVVATRNGGQDWQRQDSQTKNDLLSIAFIPGLREGWIAGDNGILLSTKNNGENWQNIEIDYLNGRLHSLGLAKGNQRLWLVGDTNSALKSFNEQNWQSSQLQYSYRPLKAAAFDSTGVQGWAISNSGAIYITEDGGANWKPQTDILNAFYYDKENQQAWLVGDDGLILHSRDSGKNWSLQDSGTRLSLNGIDFTSDSKQGLIVGDSDTVLMTKDEGKQWQRQNVNTGNNFDSVYIDEDDSKVFAWTDKELVTFTLDRPQDWKKTNISSGNSIIGILSRTLSFGIKTFLLREQEQQAERLNNKTFYTQDDGKTWQQPYYARTPAYWYWLLCFSLFLFALWLITKKPIAESQLQETVADLLASDKPLEPGDPDPLNFSSIALGLSRFMRNPATEPPLTVAITGAWGSGKSSLMNLLYHDLKNYGFTPVWFNAWHHQKGEQLLASLYANIKDQAIPGWFQFYKLIPVGLVFRLNLLGKRIKNHWLLAAVSLIVTVFVVHFIIHNGISWSDLSPRQLLNDFLGKANGSIENLLVLILGGPIAILIRWLQAFGISPEKLMTHRGDEKSKANKVDPSARQIFANEFKEVSSCLDTGRMVIFIDDLDRCSKENVVDILEAMNFLSVSGDCYIVIGMDDTWVKVCIENHFPDMVENQKNDETNIANGKTFAEHYLEKMINIPVPIPALTKNETVDLLLPQEPVLPPQSMFKRYCSTISNLILRYRVVFSLLVCMVFIGMISYLMPKDLFVEEADTKPRSQELYTWNNVSLEQFILIDGEPEIYLDIEENVSSLDKKKDKDTDNKNKGDWELILKGNPDLLSDGIEIADLGSKDKPLNLVLKRSNSAAKTSTAEDIVSELPPEALSKTKKGPAELIPGEPDSSAYDYWLPLATLLFVLFGLFAYGLKVPNRFVKDSDDFKAALKYWNPWISLQRNTPRAIKRYVNYVRYLAMRYKDSEIDTDKQGKDDLAVSEKIREESLVALSAIYAIEPSWLIEPDLLEKLKQGHINEMLIEKFKKAERIAEGSAPEKQIEQLAESLQSSIDKHVNKFGESVFKAATIEQFLEINSNTQFN